MHASEYKLALPTSRGLFFFSPEQIIRLEAKSNYTNFYFSDHKPVLTARVLKDFEKQLEPYGFTRTHRSHLVNKRHILFVDTEGNVIMQDCSRAGISRRKRREVMDELRGRSFPAHE